MLWGTEAHLREFLDGRHRVATGRGTDVHVPLRLRGAVRRVLPHVVRPDPQGVRGARGNPRRGGSSGTTSSPSRIATTGSRARTRSRFRRPTSRRSRSRADLRDPCHSGQTTCRKWVLELRRRSRCYGSTRSRSTSALTSRAISMNARAAGERWRSRCQTTATLRRGPSERAGAPSPARRRARSRGAARARPRSRRHQALQRAVVVRAEGVLHVVRLVAQLVLDDDAARARVRADQRLLAEVVERGGRAWRAGCRPGRAARRDRS